MEKVDLSGVAEDWNAYKVNLAAIPSMLKAAEIGFQAGWLAAHRRAAAGVTVEEPKPAEFVFFDDDGARPHPDPRDAVVKAAQYLIDLGEFCRTDDTESALRGLRTALSSLEEMA